MVVGVDAGVGVVGEGERSVRGVVCDERGGPAGDGEGGDADRGAAGDGERGGEATHEGNPDHAREEGFGGLLWLELLKRGARDLVSGLDDGDRVGRGE